MNEPIRETNTIHNLKTKQIGYTFSSTILISTKNQELLTSGHLIHSVHTVPFLRLIDFFFEMISTFAPFSYLSYCDIFPTF